MKFSFLLFAIDLMLKYKAWRYPSFKSRLKEKNLTAQVKVMDDSEGRSFTFADGRVVSKKGIHSRPDIVLTFGSAALASRLLLPSANPLERINAMKNFEVELHGPDELTQWFLETLSLAMAACTEYGIDLGDGTRRYVSSSAGMPVFVYAKEGKIVRVTSIDFNEEDAKPWTIRARGKTFTPPRKTTLSPYAYASKSIVYSPRPSPVPHEARGFRPVADPNNREVFVGLKEALALMTGPEDRASALGALQARAHSGSGAGPLFVRLVMEADQGRYALAVLEELHLRLQEQHLIGEISSLREALDESDGLVERQRHLVRLERLLNSVRASLVELDPEEGRV